MNQTILDKIFQAGQAYGRASQQCMKLFTSKLIDWNNKIEVQAISREFRLGRIAATLGLTKEQAIEVNNKKTYAFGLNGPGRRTEEEQRAYNSGKSSFVYLVRMAGMPTHTGLARPPRRTTTKAPKLAMPDNQEEARKFVLKLRDVMRRACNNVTEDGPWTGAMSLFIAQVDALEPRLQAAA